MPLGEKKPNIVSPILSEDKTWNNLPEHTSWNHAATLLSGDNNKENLTPQEPNKSSSSVVRRITPDSFPLVDPLKVQSKAKDPVIAPPTRLQPQKAESTAPVRLSATNPTCSTNHPSLIPVQVIKSRYTAPSVKLELLGRTRSKKGGMLQDSPKSIPPPPTLRFAEALRKNLPPTITLETKLQKSGPDSTTNTLNVASYGRRLHRLACKGTEEAAREAEGILRDMIWNFKAGKTEIRPDGGCFNSVIHAFAELGNAEAAEAVVLLMLRDFEEGNHTAQPNFRIYTSILHAWRKANAFVAPERCEAILETMDRLHESGKLPDCKPDINSYTVLFHCWAESNRKDAAKHAERLFYKMKQRFLQGQEALRPDAIAYSNILNIFTKDSEKNVRAEELLWEMVDDFLSGNKSAKPRIRNFNTVMAMWSKSSALDAPKRAQSIVRRLLQLNKTSTLDTKPDEYTYSLLLKTWASSKLPNGSSQAVKLLYWMKELYRRGDQAACPDVIKYTTCISALARTGKADKAEALLNKMRADFLNGNQKAEPDAKTFESVIAAWSGLNKNSKVDGVRAEGLLRQMWTLHDTGNFSNIRPTSHSYNRVIIAMKKCHRPDRAEALLYEMDRFCSTGKLKQGPSMQDFLTVISAWNESQFEDRKMRVHNVQVKMQQQFRRSAAQSASSSEG